MITILGFTNSFDFASLREIQSLKQNTFAASLIETISLSLTSSKGEGVEDVLKMLGDLRNQLNQDQKNDDNTFNAKNSEFNAHIKKLAEEIAQLASEIAALEARIEELANLIAQAIINIESFQDRIGNLTQTLVDLKQKLEDDTTYYTKKANGLAELNSKLLVVNEKLGKLIGSASGANVFNHINLTESEKRDIAYREEQAKTSFIQLSKSLPLAPELVELTLQADQKALQRLMSIISKFASEALDEKAEAERKLQEAKETYEILKKSMEEEIELNKQAMAKQEENKKNYENEKEAKEAEKAEKEARKEALEKEKVINEKLQAALSQTYQKEKKDRAEEIRVVGILVNIVQKRLMK
jgi:predicted  nucleic acid-binding Zn-ribbon protein